MEIINYKQIIDQEFESTKDHNFLLSGREATVKLKKINFAVRNRIEKLRQIGQVTKYEFEQGDDLDAPPMVKSSRTEYSEATIENDEKAIDLVLQYGLDPKEHNLKKDAMSLKDWREIATYFPTEFWEIVNAVCEFNGLNLKK